MTSNLRFAQAARVRQGGFSTHQLPPSAVYAGIEDSVLVIYWTESGPAANVAGVTFTGNNVSQYSTLTLLGQSAANAINNIANELNRSRYISSALPPQFRLGSGDWTIECFGRLTDDTWNSELGYATVGVDIANNSTFFSSPFPGDNAAGVFFAKSETETGVSELVSARAQFNDDVSVAAIIASADSDTSLHHISIQKSGSLIITHYQGINNGLLNSSDDLMPSQYDLGESYILLAIGGAVVDGPSHLGVALGQIRITPGVALYGTGNFTPPTEAFYIPPEIPPE